GKRNPFPSRVRRRLRRPNRGDSIAPTKSVGTTRANWDRAACAVRTSTIERLSTIIRRLPGCKDINGSTASAYRFGAPDDQGPRRDRLPRTTWNRARVGARILRGPVIVVGHGAACSVLRLSAILELDHADVVRELLEAALCTGGLDDGQHS